MRAIRSIYSEIGRTRPFMGFWGLGQGAEWMASQVAPLNSPSLGREMSSEIPTRTTKFRTSVERERMFCRSRVSLDRKIEEKTYIGRLSRVASREHPFRVITHSPEERNSTANPLA